MTWPASDSPEDAPALPAEETLNDVVRKVEDALVDAVLRDQAVELVAARRALDAVVDACDKFGFSCYPSASTDDMPDRAILVADVLAALGVVGKP